MQSPSGSSLAEQFAPVFKDVRAQATVAERFIDRSLYQLCMATLWANVVLAPDEVGLLEEDLEDLHDLINDELTATLGEAADLHSVFDFVNSKAGEQAMAEARINQTHKDLLKFFASMILDPKGHEHWLENMREQL